MMAHNGTFDLWREKILERCFLIRGTLKWHLQPTNLWWVKLKRYGCINNNVVSVPDSLPLWVWILVSRLMTMELQYYEVVMSQFTGAFGLQRSLKCSTQRLSTQLIHCCCLLVDWCPPARFWYFFGQSTGPRSWSWNRLRHRLVGTATCVKYNVPRRCILWNRKMTYLGLRNTFIGEVL